MTIFNDTNITDFTNYIFAEKMLSENTVKSYKRDINEFYNWLQQSEISKIDIKTIQYFIGHLNNKGQIASTISRKLSSLSQFFEFLVKKGKIKTNPTNGIKKPKKDKYLAKSLSVDSIDSMLNDNIGSVDINKPLIIRDIAIIELFYSSGMRLSELASINTNNLDINSSEIHITGKGNKERIVLVGEKANQSLSKWLVARKQLIKENHHTNALFLNKDGKRITVRGIQLRIKKMAKNANENINLHPHMLRHSFASHILQSSGDIRAVQKMLGHESLSSTQIYTNLDFQHLAEIYDKSHPRAKKK